MHGLVVLDWYLIRVGVSYPVRHGYTYGLVAIDGFLKGTQMDTKASWVLNGYIIIHTPTW